jgi:outer membrane lipoprotein-sorting protein
MRRWVCLLAVAVIATPFALADTAEDVVEKYLEARGGVEKMKAVESLRAECVVNMGGSEVPCVFEWKRPDKVRMEYTVKEQTAIQAFDGTTGWAYIPFMGRTTASELTPDETKAMTETSRFWGPLLDWQERGFSLTYDGMEDLDGQMCHKLMLTGPEGEITYMYIDEVYHLQIREVQLREAQGKDIQVDIRIGDYREVDGLFIPFSVKQKIQSTVVESILTFEKVELNVDIPDDRFALPTAPTPSGS